MGGTELAGGAGSVTETIDAVELALGVIEVVGGGMKLESVGASVGGLVAMSAPTTVGADGEGNTPPTIPLTTSSGEQAKSTRTAAAMMTPVFFR